MSESMDFAVPLSRPTVFGERGVERSFESSDDGLLSIATNSIHRFYFASLCWLTGVDNLVKFVLMFIPGVFLLSEVSATPGLKVQIAIVGLLLTAGGFTFFLHSLRDFLGGLAIHADGITARRGLLAETIPWFELKRWNVNESLANSADLPSIQLWTSESTIPAVSIPGGRLSEREHRLIRHLLQVFAPIKETA